MRRTQPDFSSECTAVTGSFPHLCSFQASDDGASLRAAATRILRPAVLPGEGLHRFVHTEQVSLPPSHLWLAIFQDMCPVVAPIGCRLPAEIKQRCVAPQCTFCSVRFPPLVACLEQYSAFPCLFIILNVFVHPRIFGSACSPVYCRISS